MKHLASLFLTCFLAFSVSAQTACDSLFIEGIHVNPFNEDQIILHCNNTSITQIYSYPGWKILDIDGNVIAEEQVNFFGISGETFHILDVVQPLNYEQESFTGVVEIWSGFGQTLECSFEMEVFPWRIDELTDDPYGCVPVTFYFNGMSEVAGEVSFSLNHQDQMFWEESVSWDSGEWMSLEMVTWLPSECLQQLSCYELLLNSDSNIDPFNVALNVEIDGYSVYYTNYLLQEYDSLGSFYFSPYGGDCVEISVDEIDEKSIVYPNPVKSNSAVFVEGNGKVQWYSLEGKLVLESTINGGRAEVPSKPGAWLLQIEGRPVRELIIVE